MINLTDELRATSCGSGSGEDVEPRAGGVCGGALVFGGACLALGLIGLVRGDFTLVWHPMPDDVPGRSILAYLVALLFVLGGCGVTPPATRRWAGGVLAALFLIFVLTWGRRIIAAPLMIGTWLGTAEQLFLALAGIVLTLSPKALSGRALLAASFGFGGCEVIFGLGHFLSLSETVAMTPAWAPGGPRFWALATGGAHIAAGLALITGIGAVLAARLLALMFIAFGALVWIPQVAAEPTTWFGWCGNVINTALLGAVLVIGDAMAWRRCVFLNRASAEA
ncbi:DoxX family membrane protein [Caulobacter sp.]|uniref:DoxX family membrane protein n=1 Tax=Caulobacter sp. TaxID=78 RepID=UPI0025BBB4F8|nr:DoxX family membrane protein [Caulobacter sp.]MBQ1559335.1 DoxX family membrane protein [Caulobacter sp.]